MRMGRTLFALLILQPFLFPATLYVPGDYPTIQSAVDDALDGDTIIVDPGTYVENVDVDQKTIHLKSAQGAAVTVIDGNQTGSGVKFSGAVHDASLEGFTITNGSGTLDGTKYCGGGICLFGNDSYVTIKDNIITQNSAEVGGGIYSANWAGTIIQSNTVSWNTSTGMGGGICMGYSYGDHTGKILDNLICSNQAITGGGMDLTYFEHEITGNTIKENTASNRGGGVYLRQLCNCDFLDNVISGNAAGIDGGGIYVQGSEPDCVNTIVCNNSAIQNGGGIWGDDSLQIYLLNSVVYGNTAQQGGGLYYGGGQSTSIKTLSNCILWCNQASRGDQIYLWKDSPYGAKMVVEHCNVEGGWAEVIIEPGCTLDWLDGNIDQEPLFENPAALDFHLADGSPCIDAGTGDVFWPPEFDFEGEPRMMSAAVDMGADEFWSDLFTVRVPEDYACISEAVVNVFSGYTILVAPGTYHEDVRIHAKDIIVKSTHGPRLTVIEGTGETSTLFLTGDAYETTEVEGFTITGGCGREYYLGGPSYYPMYARRGGGVFVEECRTVFRDCIITGNQVDGYGMFYADGGGLYFEDTGPAPCVMLNCLIADNLITSGDGGGAVISNDSIVDFINCTFTRNHSTSQIGGLFLMSSDSSVTNSIFYGNTTGWPGNENFYAYGDPPVTYSNVGGGWPGTANIDADPLFADSMEGDYHLTYLSPCKDTGDNHAPNLPDLDFEGDPRIAYGTADMGCDEFSPHLYYTGDAVPSGTLDVKCAGLPGSSLNGMILGVNIFDPPLPCDYGLWYMDHPMQILMGLGVLPAEGIAVFSGTVPATPPGPYSVYLQAVVDSWLTNLCEIRVE